MKKVLAILLALITLAMGAFLVACDVEDDPNKDNENQEENNEPSGDNSQNENTPNNNGSTEGGSQTGGESGGSTEGGSKTGGENGDNNESVTPTVKNGLSFKTLTVNGNEVYGKVSNTTDTFSFINEISVSGNSKFVVSTDLTGTNTVNTKTIALSVGDNTVYITEYVDEEPVNLYKVTVRRCPMYTVSFNANNGSTVKSQTVEEDSFATVPATVTKSGYTFIKWNYDFNTPITKNITVSATWRKNTNIPYKVEYYLQNLNDDNYTLKTTENKTGTVDTTATAEIKKFEHFTHNQTSNDSGNISGDGTTVLKVYYTRNKYTVTSDTSLIITVNNTGTYKYGTQISISVSNINLGYEIGFYCGEQLLSKNQTYTVAIDRDITVKFKIKEDISDFEFTSTTTTCTITGVKKNVTNAVLPNYVTAIKENAFKNCTSLTSISVPNSVTSIGSSAFSGCGNLTSITLPFIGGSASATEASAKTLLGYIFGTSSYTGGTETKQCYSSGSYTTYYIPTSLKTVTITGGKILYGAFYKCSNLTSITIGNGVTIIGDSAFSGCSGLTSITLPFVGGSASATEASAETLFGYIFGTSSYTGGTATRQYYNNYKTYYIPTSLKTVTITGGKILSHAFYNCSNITSLTIGNSVTSIGDDAFSSCIGLTSVTIGNGITSIGEYAFHGCEALISINVSTENTAYKSIDGNLYTKDGKTLIQYVYGKTGSFTIPNGVTIIGDSAFCGCTGLTSITIGNGVIIIGNETFENCSGLTSITIPDSVKSIGISAFDGCTGLTSITIPDSVTSIGDEAFCDTGYYNNKSNWENGVLYIGNYLIEAKRDISGAYSIKDGTLCIADNAFKKCIELTSVTIPSTVTSIGSSAFCDCTRLTSINVSIENTVYKSIDGNLYTKDGKTLIQYACGKTDKNFTIPNSVTSIGYSAVEGCKALTSLTIPDSVTSISNYAFYECTKLENIYYTGTQTQWNNISKEKYWDYYYNYHTGNQQLSYTLTYNYKKL